MASLIDMIKPARKTAIVDVGAAAIDEVPPYRGLVLSGAATLIGFEPNAELRPKDSDDATFLPNVIGDGLEAVMHICQAPGMNSLLRPKEAALEMFTDFSMFGRVLRREGVITTQLDDVVKEMDYLKIDVQGAEQMVFDGAVRLLSHAVAVHTEVSFVQIYHNQPTFGDIDADLRARGFIPHKLVGPKYWPVTPNRTHLEQLLEMDIVYFRDFARMQDMGDEQLKHLALIAAYAYDAESIAARCITELKRRN
jgi:FkbM family methyltransferase